ncbi:HNH endonuclease [Acidiferrimicrobium sp. IK]|uniref:HNH endonuclease n=1 Tax=Acidiferrimicrobium sp. IK TaxID=2871700 RepID=UPI0021CB78FC|nr:HNH endonuclease [Acidiferrimicrobium sp. IK]MCU4184586.1 HNH endonuclease [Acidiferrimicrobium sp. IK]
MADSKPGRNPTWAVDELVPALDLYLRSGLLDDSSAEVQELSNVLNALPIHTVHPDVERFRNPNGVALKLANFAALDPNYPGVGMSRGSRADGQVWDRYHTDRDELRRVAAGLRAGASGEEPFPVLPEEGEDEISEGRLLYRRHRTRERSRALSNRKKAEARSRGQLAGEVCGFDFQVTYGELGRDFIECHHVRPLSASGPTTTRLKDLALLCSNCHRMAHRGDPWPDVEQLQSLIDAAGKHTSVPL